VIFLIKFDSLITFSLFIYFSRWQINQHNDDNSTTTAAAAKVTAVSSADAKDKNKNNDKDNNGDKLTRVSVTLSR
jgi:hypothetical protein